MVIQLLFLNPGLTTNVAARRQDLLWAGLQKKAIAATKTSHFPEMITELLKPIIHLCNRQGWFSCLRSYSCFDFLKTNFLWVPFCFLFVSFLFLPGRVENDKEGLKGREQYNSWKISKTLFFSNAMFKKKVHLMWINNRKVSKDTPVNVIICPCKVHHFSSSSQAYLWQLKIWLIIFKRSFYPHIWEAVICLGLKRGKQIART